jgi:hypothetical protein
MCVDAVSNGARRAAAETDLMQRLVTTNTSTANIVKPEVSLKHLPFYDVITEIMKPSCLGNSALFTIVNTTFQMRQSSS